MQAVKRRYRHLDTEIGQVTWRDTRVGRLGWHWAMKQLRTHDDDTPPLSITSEGTCSQGSWTEAPPQIADWMAFGAALVQAVGDVESASLGTNEGTRRALRIEADLAPSWTRPGPRQ